MRIAIDATVATKQLGGISEYTRNLLVGLSQLPEGAEYFLLRFGYNETSLQPLPALPANFHEIHKRIPQKLLNLGWSWFGWPQVKGWLPDYDVFFAPHFLLPAGTFTKLVVTVHDALFLDHAEWFLPRDVENFTRQLRAACGRADHVITVSETSRESLIRHRLVRPEMVTAIPNGVDMKPASDAEIRQARAKYRLPDRYLLFLGTLEPRKNIMRQLEVYARLRKHGVTQKFVLAGRRGWIGHELEETIRRLDLEESVVLLGDFAREDKPGIYGGASIFLFPSLAEGFGIPPLEAMVAGVPVVTANTSSLPEVVGDAALTVDPTDIDAMTSAVLSILTDEALSARLRAAGKKRAAGFDWKVTARQTQEIFRRVAA